ncbi:MAG TPA: CAP domain-containing protein [Candidatus Paceibacterota bacterium]|nr:CAP domain-containing protein [Candidatus Paceibacterota bacterium]
MNPQKRWHEHVKDHLVPHQGNDYRPKILATEVIVGLLLAVLLIQGIYVVGKEVAFKSEGFLASVLPGVLISLTNADREEHGVGQVTENALLMKAAQLKANDMAAKGYFSHVTPDGREPWYWIAEAGYDYEYAGENLAVNFEDSAEVEEAWMNSPTHRANIVKPVYTEIGIATARGIYKGEEVTFVVQYFASPRTVAVVAPEPTPVISEPEVIPEPEPTPIVSEVVTEEPAETTVLGEAAPVISSPQVPAFVAEAAASPDHTMTIVFSILAGAVGILLILSIAAHLRAPYVEALGGTFALLVIVVGLMAFNTIGGPALEVPTDGQAASVHSAF